MLKTQGIPGSYSVNRGQEFAEALRDFTAFYGEALGWVFRAIAEAQVGPTILGELLAGLGIKIPSATGECEGDG